MKTEIDGESVSNDEVVRIVAEELRRGSPRVIVVLPVSKEDRIRAIAGAAHQVEAESHLARRLWWTAAGGGIGLGWGLVKEYGTRVVVGCSLMGAALGFAAGEVFEYVREHSISKVTMRRTTKGDTHVQIEFQRDR